VDYFSKLTAHSKGSVSTTILVYCVMALPFTALVLIIRSLVGKYKWQRKRNPWRIQLSRRHPLSLGICFFLVTILFFSPEPWKQMRSTLIYDVTRGIVSAAGVEFRNEFATSSNNTDSITVGNLLYNPADDPYYVSNLDNEVYPLISNALKDIKFTNIVQIVLESVRADSYPFQEDGLLHQFIKTNIQPAENATPITTQTITPFIDSLGEHTIIWDQVWSLCPLTNKALLGCNSLFRSVLIEVHCGLIPLPVDFGAEVKGSAKFYQTCLAGVLRHLNTSEPWIHAAEEYTDEWETAQISSCSLQWDNSREHLRRAGFSTILDAEYMDTIRGPRKFDHFQGYWDEGPPPSTPLN
jgi:hypothetical protein